MKILKKVFVAGTLVLASLAAQAEIVTFGNLTSDSDYDIIADTVMGREYLRFDTFDFTYAQTVAAIQIGGQYEGWSIADSDISDNFINALFSQNGENSCSTGLMESYGELCGSLSGWVKGNLGESYLTHEGDHYAYLSTHESEGRVSQEIGLGYITKNGEVRDYDDWLSIDYLDTFNSASGQPINLLLYRDNSSHIGGFDMDAVINNIVASASVPLPASLGLLGLSMVGFGFRRKETNSD